MAANLVFLVVGEENLGIGHAGIVGGCILHATVQTSHGVGADGQLCGQSLQCRGVDGLRGGFRQVARVADDACQHDAGGLVVDGDALFLIHLVDDGVGGANHLAAHKGDAAVCNVALHMVVYLLQDNGFAGTLHALRIVGVVGQDEPCLRHHARLQFGQREAEHAGDIGRLAVHPARHLGLAVVAHQPHQPGIRQGRGDGIHRTPFHGRAAESSHCHRSNRMSIQRGCLSGWQPPSIA